MIYLDNAATTYPKPLEVMNAVQIAVRKYGANPGRSGHRMSMDSAMEIYDCRKRAARFFNASGPENVVFTLNCTHALNIVLKGLLKPGDHVVTSCLEHNAVMRPLQNLSDKGISYTCAKVFPGDHTATVNAFRDALRENTKLIVCTVASNVWGIRLPVERIAALGTEYGIPMLVDAAQGAGVVPIDVQDSGIAYLCVAGHKGLYGPMGTGMLITEKGEQLDTIVEGGTGTDSIRLTQPDTLPERFESGTPNMPGIAGLNAGLSFVEHKGVTTIFRHEMELMQKLYDKLSQMDTIELYTQRPDECYYVPLVSFNVQGKDSETVAAYLNQNEIAVRPGLHCAPAAHQFLGTLERGAVRVCPSAFTNSNDIGALLAVLLKIIVK